MTHRFGAVEVRPARAGDREFVLTAAARLSAFGAPAGRTAEEIVEGEARTLRAFFDRPDPLETLLVADADGRASGFLFLEEKEDYFTRERHGHIGMLVVALEAEGRGAGAALMRAAESWARSRGHRKLTLNVFAGNARARGMYEHFGFAPDTIKYLKTLEGSPDVTEPTLAFGGSIPEIYDRRLGPVLFEPYAVDLAARVAAEVRQGTVLELACGTGIVTSHLRAALPPHLRLIATDLSEAMVAFARRDRSSTGIDWRQADAMALPFADGSMAAVACQFGLMFVPDKALAIREALRVLEPSGRLWLSVWDSVAANPSAAAANRAVAALTQPDPPPFFQVPHGLHDGEALGRLIEAQGFESVRVEMVEQPAVSESAESFAIGYVRGTPLSLVLAERGVDFDRMVEAVAGALRAVGGDHPYRSVSCAWVISASKAGLA